MIRMLMVWGCLLTGIASWGMDGTPSVVLQGIVTEIDGRTEKSAGDVQVLAISSIGDSLTTTTNASGHYKLRLPLGDEYTVYFNPNKKASKFVLLNTRSVPEEKQADFELILDMTLLKRATSAQQLILESTPIAKAAYSSRKNTFEFDFKHSRRVYKLLEGEATKD